MYWKKSVYKWPCSVHTCCCLRVSCTLPATEDTKVNETLFLSSNCGWEHFFSLGYKAILWPLLFLFLCSWPGTLGSIFLLVFIYPLFTFFMGKYALSSRQPICKYNLGHYMLICWGILYSQRLHMCLSVDIVVICKVFDSFLVPSSSF